MAAPTGIQGQTLEITVVGCNKLRDTEWISRQDPYVCLEYASTKFRTLTCTDGGKNPTFNEKFMFTLIEGLREINVQVWNSNTLSHDDFIGSGKIQLHKVLSQGFDDTAWPISSRSGKYSGEVKLIMYYAGAPKQGKPTAAAAAAAASPYPAGAYPPPPPYPPHPPTSSPYPPHPPTSSPYPPHPPTSSPYPPPYGQPSIHGYPTSPYPPASSHYPPPATTYPPAPTAPPQLSAYPPPPHYPPHPTYPPQTYPPSQPPYPYPPAYPGVYPPPPPPY